MLALGAAAAILGLYRADEVFARFNQNLGAVAALRWITSFSAYFWSEFCGC
jgi:hypothetical protein